MTMRKSTRIALRVGASLLLLSGLVLAVPIPHTFTAGTSIKSAEVNANFAALNTGKQEKLTAFKHVARTSGAANTSANYTYIDNPATNGDPNAILIVTPNRSGGVFYSGSISVQYDATNPIAALANKWTILHDIGPSSLMQDNEAFNVLVLKP